MAEPEMTSEERLTKALGGLWDTDQEIYEIDMRRRSDGGTIVATFQYRATGGVLTTPSGDLAIKDARSF